VVRADGSSSLAAPMSMVMELLEGRIDVVAANGVRWGSRSALVATVSHFLELKTLLEVLRPARNAYLKEDDEDALWTQVRATLDSLALYVPFSVARNPPNGARE
jgi:hypothetical protein